MQKLMSAAELAAYLSVPIKTLYQWNYHGTGPKYIRVGNAARYRVSDVETWLRQHEKAAA